MGVKLDRSDRAVLLFYLWVFTRHNRSEKVLNPIQLVPSDGESTCREV